MSRAVLNGPLLDFGLSYWGSPLMLRELPGLLGTGFEPTGQFGIGFFAVFMVARRVTVTTRRYDAGQAETTVLEFANGLDSRPILRPADTTERLLDGGTRVRVSLDRPVADLASPLLLNSIRRRGIGVEALEGRQESPVPQSELFERFCAWLFPALDVNLHVQKEDGPVHRVVAASDWLRLPPSDLVLRLYGVAVPSNEEITDSLQMAESFMQPIVDGELTAGRAFLLPPTSGFVSTDRGVITTGGIRVAEIEGVVGVMNGSVETAARQDVSLAIESAVLANWADEQGRIAQHLFRDDSERLAGYAARIAMFGGDPRTLPMVEFRGEWVSGNDIRSWRAPADTYLLVEASLFDGVNIEGKSVQMPDDYGNVFVLTATSIDYEPLRPSGHSLGTSRALRTRFHLIVEAWADLWGADPRAVLDVFDDTPMLRVIGRHEGKPVKAYATVLRNPNASS